MIPDKHKKRAAWVSICVACVGTFEGLRTYAYRDPVGIPTACFGETRGIKLGDTFSVEQCKDMLGKRVLEFGEHVDACIHADIPPQRKAAYTSLAYNVGAGAFCNSSIVRYELAGYPKKACASILLYNKARGVVLPGLVNRRQAEYDLCMESFA